MAGHILGSDTECRGYCFLNGLWILGGTPGFHFSVLPLGNGDRRLHGSMRQHRNIVVGFVFLSGAGECLFEIATVSDDFARLMNAGEEFLLISIGRKAGMV